MEISALLLVATFLLSLTSSILSGLASGGGGFVMSSWQLLIGMSPAEMTSNGSIGGSAMAISSLIAYKKGKTKQYPRESIIFAAIAALSAAAGSYVVPHLHAGSFKLIIASLTFASLPLFFSKHRRLVAGTRSRRDKILGYFVVSLLLLLGSIIFSSAFSLLAALALPFFFGMSTLESAVVRRWMGLAQLIVLAVMLHRYIVWVYVLISIPGGALGSYIGTHIAVKKGETFARSALAIMTVVSAASLLV